MEEISKLGPYGNAKSGVSGFADCPPAAAALTKTAMQKSTRFTLLIVDQLSAAGEPS